MHSKHGMVKPSRSVIVVLTLCVLVPATSRAQAAKAGVVTTLEGNVTATRAAAPLEPVALKFKDDVLLQDRITTGEQSLARLLLGGKAVVTVRERSILTIAEAPGRSTIEIESGKFALVVARERMRTGEVIEIRTPNAIAGVRGTVVITEVASVPSATTAQPPRVVSNFYVLRGSVEAQLLDPSTRAPIGAPRMINVLERFSVTGIGAGAVTPIRPEQVQPIHAGLQPKSYPPTMMGANRQAMTARAMQGAVVLATALAPPPSKPQTTNPGQQATPTEPAEPAALAGPTARAGSRAPPGPTAPLAALPALLASRAPFALLTRVTSLTPIIPRVVDTKTITGPPPKPPAPPK